MRFDAELWAERLDLPYLANTWHNYYFRKALNIRQVKKTITQPKGTIKNISGFKPNQQLRSVLPAILNREWDKCCSLYGGIIAFLLKRCEDEITYFDHYERRDSVSMIQCCENLHFPHWAKPYLDKIFKDHFSFEDYLHGFDNTKKINFDIESAVQIVKMQGEDAIFSVLMQLFHVGKYICTNTANLVPSLPMVWIPHVSHLANSTGFPVVVSKFSDKLNWRWIQGNCFLFDEYNNVIDCASVGRFNVFRESLGNRLSFVGRSGFKSDYCVCWSWDDLFDAVGLYGGDLLVRNMSGGFNGWYKFGPNAQLVVWTKNVHVYCRGSKTYMKDFTVLPIKSLDKVLDVINICGEKVVGVEPEEEQVWTEKEIRTWFEVGKICKKKLKED